MIQNELQSIDLRDSNAVASLCHLSGAINESMRLLPAVLTFVTRVSPPEGMEVEGTWIPGNVKIAAPRYSIGRCKSASSPGANCSQSTCLASVLTTSLMLVEMAWEDPHAFCPERWYSRQDMIKDKRAFAPFGLGTSLCSLRLFPWISDLSCMWLVKAC